MKRLISFPLERGGSVQLEVEEEAGAAVTRGLHPAAVVETISNSFEATLAAIKPAAIAVAQNFRSIGDAPESVEVEFGVKFAGHAGAFIACASTEAQFRVKLVWQSKEAT